MLVACLVKAMWLPCCRGANARLMDSRGRTALHWSAHNDEPEAVRLLLASGKHTVPELQTLLLCQIRVFGAWVC